MGSEGSWTDGGDTKREWKGVAEVTFKWKGILGGNLKLQTLDGQIMKQWFSKLRSQEEPIVAIRL